MFLNPLSPWSRSQEIAITIYTYFGSKLLSQSTATPSVPITPPAHPGITLFYQYFCHGFSVHILRYSPDKHASPKFYWEMNGVRVDSSTQSAASKAEIRATNLIEMALDPNYYATKSDVVIAEIRSKFIPWYVYTGTVHGSFSSPTTQPQTSPRKLGASPAIAAPYGLTNNSFPNFDEVSVGADFGISSCDHDFKEYHGFMESYKYCTKCDHKQGEKK